MLQICLRSLESKYRVHLLPMLNQQRTLSNLNDVGMVQFLYPFSENVRRLSSIFNA